MTDLEQVYSFLDIWHPNTKCELNWVTCPHKMVYMQYDSNLLENVISIKDHDIPMPILTSDLAMQILVGMDHKGYLVQLINKSTSDDTWDCDIGRPEWNPKEWVRGRQSCWEDAIVEAVAKIINKK